MWFPISFHLQEDHQLPPIESPSCKARPRSLSESLHIFTAFPASSSPSPTRVGKVSLFATISHLLRSMRDLVYCYSCSCCQKFITCENLISLNYVHRVLCNQVYWYFVLQQCFSPSMQAPVTFNGHNFNFSPSPTPSPTRRVSRRSVSPIVMKPSALSLKRKRKSCLVLVPMSWTITFIQCHVYDTCSIWLMAQGLFYCSFRRHRLINKPSSRFLIAQETLNYYKSS